MANKIDFSKGTPREEMVRCIMLSALKDHCSIIRDMAKVHWKSCHTGKPLKHFEYDSRRIEHLAKTFGETI